MRISAPGFGPWRRYEHIKKAHTRFANWKSWLRRARQTQLAHRLALFRSHSGRVKKYLSESRRYSGERGYFLTSWLFWTREKCTPGRWRRPGRKEGQQEGPIVVDWLELTCSSSKTFLKPAGAWARLGARCVVAACKLSSAEKRTSSPRWIFSGGAHAQDLPLEEIERHLG